MRHQASRFLASAILAGCLWPVAASAQTASDSPKPDNSGRKQLYDYLDSIAVRQNQARRTAVAAITTPAAAKARQQQVRTTLLRLLGPLPQRTDLKPQITGTSAMDGFRVDKVLFESQPNFPVTALLYVPTASTNSKFPAIVMAPGHSPAGKAGDVATATAFARAGFIVLSYDPIGQGERLQYPDPANPGHTLSKAPTGEHGEAGIQPTLIGDAVAQYFLWDGMRAVDYLQTRPEVDPKRIGAFGCSGGGAMTALLGALDPRIAAVGTACYWTNYNTLLPAIGPQDAEQSIPGFSAAGLDFPDWVELAAPRPYAMIATTSDMFPFAGAKVTEAEARKFYGTLGADKQLQFIIGPGGHGNLRPIMPQILRFFTEALHPDPFYARDLPPISDPFATPSAPPRQPGERPTLPPPPPASLTQVTPTGQVATSYPGAATVFTLNKAKADGVDTPKGMSLAALRTLTRKVTHAEAIPGQSRPQVTGGSNPLADGMPERLNLQLTSGETLSLWVHPLAGRHPATLILKENSEIPNSSARETAAENQTELFVFTPRPSPPGNEDIKSPLLGPFYLTELRAELVGKTLMGLRIDDVIRAIDYILARPEVDPSNLTVVAEGHLATVALHAAILDERIAHVTDGGLRSYRDLVNNPMPRDAPQDVLPGVLRRYDLPDLRQALGPRLSQPAQVFQ